jgi:hypothetical protein
MASVSMIEGLAKKFINMVPRPFYTEAAQKLVHEICETIYKDLETEENKKYPRVEIIDIVEKFVDKHLGNPPENPNENPMGIRDAISDSLAKTTLEIYKDDIVNMLLLQKILSEEIDGKIPKQPPGIFYKSLEESIRTAKDPVLLKNLGKKIAKGFNTAAQDVIATGKAIGNVGIPNIPKLIDKQKVFAKNVLAALPNVNIEDSNEPSVISTDETNNPDQKGGGGNGIIGVLGDNASKFAKTNPMLAATGMAIGAAMLSRSQSNSGNGSGSGNGGTTNIGYEPNKNGVLPYIQTNCNGSGLGLPGIDLVFLG